jgi:hypothetical protein
MTPSSLYSDFGSHRSTEQLTLPELALPLLGRNLYQLAELPKPPGDVALTMDPGNGSVGKMRG